MIESENHDYLKCVTFIIVLYFILVYGQKKDCIVLKKTPKFQTNELQR